MKNKIIKRTIGILLSLTMLSGVTQGLGLGVKQAYASVLGIGADKDTFVDNEIYIDGNRGIGESNFAPYESNWVGSMDGGVQNSKSAIHFNLNGVTSNVTDAKLQIYTTYATPGITSFFNLYGSYNDSWPESTTIIPQQSTVIVPNQPVTAEGQWITIDVTNFINGEINGDKQATFVLSAISGGFAFASREATNGSAPRLFIATVSNSIITPATASFDKNTSAQADVTTSIAANGNSLINITNNGVPLVVNTDYTVSGNVVTIKKGYLAGRPEGTTALQFNFSAGAPQTLAITVSDTTPKYTVTFKDYNGTVIGTPQTVTYGGAATAPSNPTRVGYTFAGWDKSFNNITSNTDVNATYSASNYTVTFKDYNGTVIGTPQVVSYGGTATAPSNPVRAGYTFTGWDKSFNNITRNTDVNATYSASNYTVIFRNYDGTVLWLPQTVSYGGTAIAPPIIPTRTGYTFTGWDKSFNNITDNLDVNPTYSANNYTVTFRDYNGAVIGMPQTVSYGGTAIEPSINPTRTGYTFTGWDRSLNNVTGNLDVNATYSIKHFLVSFVDNDGVTTIGTSQSIEYGGVASPPIPPVKEGYTFAGWDKEFNLIEGDIVVVAQYNINHYAVTFQDYDGTQIGTVQRVEYGHGAVAPQAPAREGYTFAGWDKSFDHITGNLIVKATYTINHYDVTFQNYDGTQIGAVQSVEYGHGVTAPEVQLREGYGIRVLII
ncbi:InlB B-repeat-containing protein [Inconstantimicrobium mannanitabidum]|uniref:Uncharacterized protein n=1 Tax=Inconstantimicrobium mannanitabidum TaxID=1604901 RepID=A0ACB5RE00_9CLOT|nr:InlB B-repeat-containing protein [Clostridium sp. TW13]GKX67499.1 hypothetical protein rsdtw13_27570 [Clostridium sp. TW13]